LVKDLLSLQTIDVHITKSVVLTSQMNMKKRRPQIRKNLHLSTNSATLSEIVSTGYKPRRVSAPRRMASLPKRKAIEILEYMS
jgi:hypothetical protein